MVKEVIKSSSIVVLAFVVVFMSQATSPNYQQLLGQIVLPPYLVLLVAGIFVVRNAGRGVVSLVALCLMVSTAAVAELAFRVMSN